MFRIIQYSITFTLMILLFTGMLAFSSLIPSNYLKANVESSSKLLMKEGNKNIHYIFLKNHSIQFDNFSDALMINTAYSIDSNTPLYSSFVARKNYIPNSNQKIFEDSIGELHSASKYKNYHDEVAELNDTLKGETKESFEYARYWHGYLLFLRPLLCVLNLFQIRILITCLLLLLAISVFYSLYHKLGFFYMLAFLLGFINVEYFYMGLSIHGCFIFLITMIFMKVLLEKFDKIKDISFFFFLIGMITNYFDLLSNPLISLFVPLLLYFLLFQKERILTIKDSTIIFLRTGFPWLFGYILTWLSKWIIVDFLYKRNILLTSFGQVHFRISGDLKVGRFSSILINLPYIAIPIILTIMIFSLVLYFRRKKYTKKISFQEFIIVVFPYILISSVPYIWYFLIKDHSFKHHFFVYREQIMTLIGISILFIKYMELNVKDKK